MALDDWAKNPEELLTFDQLAIMMSENWERHNTKDQPRGLGGLTPAAAYTADGTPIKKADPAAIRLALMTVSKQRTVSREGVEWSGCFYTGAVLADHVGRRVEVRGRRHDRRYVEVFYLGEHVGQIGLAKEQSVSARGKIAQSHKEHKAKTAAHFAAGKIINADEMRERLRGRGVPESDLPAMPGTEDDAPAVKQAPKPAGTGRRGVRRVPVKAVGVESLVDEALLGMSLPAEKSA